MEKKNSTKYFLAESLRTLITRMPFQNITIKKICDEAGVVRVTFYNYFVDKYDALDYLIQSDCFEDVDFHSNNPMKSLIEHLATTLVEHRKFYRIASEIDGQNGFQELFIARIKEALLKIFEYHRKSASDIENLPNAFLAETYAVMVFYFVIAWLHNGQLSEEDFVQSAMKMCHSSFYDFVNEA